MTKRETRATIDELATECNRLEAENEVLRARLTAVTHCLGQLVGVSSGLHAWLIDEYFLCKQLEEQTRKDKVGRDVKEDIICLLNAAQPR